MFNEQELRQFLVKAKSSTYAAGDVATKIIEADGSTTFVFEEGRFTYHDNYFGGEPFGGREVVLFDNKPIFIMVYYGGTDASYCMETTHIYQILMNALKLVPGEHPYRGPENYTEATFVYTNNFTGDINNFSGKESITCNDRLCYTAIYAGGLVNQR